MEWTNIQEKLPNDCEDCVVKTNFGNEREVRYSEYFCIFEDESGKQIGWVLSDNQKEFVTHWRIRLDYITEKQNEINGNTSTYSVGEFVRDQDGVKCEILQKTPNSINVLIFKKSKLGITSDQWFPIKDFEKRFKKLS